MDKSKNHKKEMKPYQKHNRCNTYSSSDDEDFQYGGKPIQKAEMLKAVDTKNYDQFYTPKREEIMKKTHTKKWLEKNPRLYDELSDDENPTEKLNTRKITAKRN